jgi:hypothetical protein
MATCEKCGKMKEMPWMRCYVCEPLPVERLVSLRFRRIGKNKLRSHDGRWTLLQSSPRAGRASAVWCIYDSQNGGRAADIGTWGQCRATALQRLKSEAKANGADERPAPARKD